MTEERLSGYAFSEDEIVERLRMVAEDGNHVIPLKFADPREEALYRELASLGLIRWCPYPEEFYVITTEGQSRLMEDR